MLNTGGKTSVKTVKPKDNQIQTPLAKEQEPSAALGEEGKILAEIKTSAEALDREALGEVQKSVAEARQARPEPELPPDVADAGVISPQQAAEEVVTGGATLELPISEDRYKEGLHRRIAGRVTEKVVYGASSLAALAMWVGRLIKMAHKHTMRVIFRKEDRT